MFDEISAAPHSAEQVDALLALASATLRRKGPALTESRARCAEHLLALVSAVSEPGLHRRIRLLLLLAWLQLGAVVERALGHLHRLATLKKKAKNWRRVEILMAGFPAGAQVLPPGTPSAVTAVATPAKVATLAKSPNDCIKLLVKGAYNLP